MATEIIVPASCEGCGECCHSINTTIYVDRTSEIPVEYLINTPFGSAMGAKENGSCLALDENGNCKVYDIRPQTCREFARGTKECKMCLLKALLPANITKEQFRAEAIASGIPLGEPHV